MGSYLGGNTTGEAPFVENNDSAVKEDKRLTAAAAKVVYRVVHRETWSR